MRPNHERLARLRRRLLPLGFLLTLLAVRVAGSSPAFQPDDTAVPAADRVVTGALLLARKN